MTDKRKEQEAASRAKLAEVVKAGELAGYWVQRDATAPDGGESWQFVTVETEGGRLFQLKAGGWNKEAAISARLTTLHGAHGLKISPHEVRGGGAAPDASASHTRPAETIAKDLHRRAMVHPDAVAVSDAMRERLAELVRDWEALRAHVATLEALGFTFHQLGGLETYSARGFMRDAAARSLPYEVTLYNNGRVTFGADTTADRMGAVLAVLREGAK